MWVNCRPPSVRRLQVARLKEILVNRSHVTYATKLKPVFSPEMSRFMSDVGGPTALVKENSNNIYTPTGFERYTANYCLGGYTIHYTLWDTSGSSAYDSVRPLSYKDASVFLLCFTIASPDTLRSALNKWYPEIREHSGATIPVILCGCQSDLRSDPQTMLTLAQLEKKPVTAEQALAVSRQIHATTYVETSARCCPRTVRDAFEVAALAAQGRLNKNHTLLRNATAAKNNSKELNRAARNCALM